MTASDELSIVIPVRNHEVLLPRLLASLAAQDYPHISNVTIYVADGGSTDRTVEVAFGFRAWLNVVVIAGGSPCAGRNTGAALAQSKYLLFIAPDAEIGDCTLVRRAVEAIKRESLDCVTTGVSVRGLPIRYQFSCAFNNIVGRLLQFLRPMGTAAFLMIAKESFIHLGGFDEEARHSDYELTSQISPRKFRVIRGHVLVSGNSRPSGNCGISAAWFLRGVCGRRFRAGYATQQKVSSYR